MARSTIIKPSDDLITDSGSILWSFVMGEQLEFPISLNFLDDASAGYIYEAVVLESLNVAQQIEKPEVLKQGGIQTALLVRTGNNRGDWNAVTAYSREDVVNYLNKYYRILVGTNVVNSTTPDLSPLWEETGLNRIYLQFPTTLGKNWEVQPGLTYNTYGFFELRVTEPLASLYPRTWKPLRGMVQIHFSPTDVVPD